MATHPKYIVNVKKVASIIIKQIFFPVDATLNVQNGIPTNVKSLKMISKSDSNVILFLLCLYLKKKNQIQIQKINFKLVNQVKVFQYFFFLNNVKQFKSCSLPKKLSEKKLFPRKGSQFFSWKRL